MERFSEICNAHSRVSRNINIRARRLNQSAAVPGMDSDDIAQELRLHLILRHDKFDPTRGSYETFADRVLANRVRAIAAPTERLRAERAWIDLDAPASGADDDEMLALAEILPESAGQHSFNPRNTDEKFGLQRDVNRFFHSLPEHHQQLASAMIDMSPTDAARALGIHRSTVYAWLAAIRNAAERCHLQEYLRVTPTQCPARL